MAENGGSENLVVTAETLRNTATHVDTVKSNLDGQLKAIGNHMTALGGSWDGLAAIAFQRIMGNWKVQSDQLNSALTDIAGNMRTSANAFESSDDDAVRTIVNAAGAGPLDLN